MKKIAFLGSVILCSALNADSYFTGLAFSSVDIGVTQTNGGGKLSDTGNYSLKFGHQDKDNRLYIKTGKLHSKDKDSYTSTSLNFDWLSQTRSAAHTLYAGVHGGFGTLKLNNYDNTGYEYGVQIGGLSDITQDIEFEVGARYTKSNAQIKSTALDGKVNYIFDFFVGLNYHF